MSLAVNRSLLTRDFDFDLPPDLIAQTPLEPRDHARLLHVSQNSLHDHHVYDLPRLLREGDVLVVNNTKVIPARLFGHRGEARVEVLLHKREKESSWLAFARPGKRLRVGDTIHFSADFSATVLEKRETGDVLIQFPFTEEKVMEALIKYGEPPLPPYIRRDEGEACQDQARYQTLYARHDGAVAAPTAGLHFTKDLLSQLQAQGIELQALTLHVGAGTFLPVKADAIKDHVMHAEWGHIEPAAAAAITRARKDNRRIVAVGTTSLRLLETATDEQGITAPFVGDTSIFITPGYRFKAVDLLMTNFHLPKSTLFMLVSAFAGMKTMQHAYRYAIEHHYRFYSYGDATLLELQ